VIYHVYLRNGERLEIDNPVRLPDPAQIERIEEPMVRVFLLCQNEQIGDMLQLIMERRGDVLKTESLDAQRVMLTSLLPLNEILIDFHDSIKSVSRGYASMDYEPAGYRPGDLVRLDILVHGEVVEAFSSIVHRDKAASRGRQMCQKLKDVVPPQMFSVE